MDFKAELVKELGLGAIAEATMLEDYIKACEAIVVRYHESEVKNLNLASINNQRELLIDFAEKINANCDDAHVDINLIGWYLEFKDNL